MKTLRQWKKLWNEGFSPEHKLFADGKDTGKPKINNHKLRAALRLLLIYIGDRNDDFTSRFSFPTIRKPKKVISDVLWKLGLSSGKIQYKDEIPVAYPASMQEVEDNKKSQLYSLTEYEFGQESHRHDTSVNGTPITDFLQEGNLYNDLILKYVGTQFKRIKNEFDINGKTEGLETIFKELKGQIETLYLHSDFRQNIAPLKAKVDKFSPNFFATQPKLGKSNIDPYVETVFRKGDCQYKVSFSGTSTNNTQSDYKFQALIRHEQIDDLLEAIATELAKDNTPIYRNGDLHKILQIIKEKTGKTIAVKYADFGIDHLAAIAKDFRDFIKPYKESTSGYYWKRDLEKPFLGIYNLFKVLLTLLAVPLLFIRNFFELIFNTRSWEDAEDNLAILFFEPAEYLLDGLCLSLLAITQVAAAPLNFVKIPIRTALTYFLEKRMIEEDSGFKKLEKLGTDEAKQHMDRKFEKHIGERGRSSNYPSDRDHKFFQPKPLDDTDTLTQGLDLKA